MEHAAATVFYGEKVIDGDMNIEDVPTWIRLAVEDYLAEQMGG